MTKHFTKKKKKTRKLSEKLFKTYILVKKTLGAAYNFHLSFTVLHTVLTKYCAVVVLVIHMLLFHINFIIFYDSYNKIYFNQIL